MSGGVTDLEFNDNLSAVVVPLYFDKIKSVSGVEYNVA